MSAGFYLTSGFLYLNMAPEVMFVLINRMKAQKIDMDKVGSKIVSDITLSLYRISFIQKLLKPQAPIYIPTFYQIFHSIINNSALKLDKSSMEKLFYLILMTIKKQFYLSSSCMQLFTITKTHFTDLILSVQQITKNKQTVGCLVQSLKHFEKFAKELTYIQYLQIRQQMLSMLESYHSKIVLFVETGYQNNNDGHLLHKFRNAHNRKSVGKAINHPDIDFAISQNIIRVLQYDRYEEWVTDLGKDDYQDIRGSSKNMKASKISRSKINTARNQEEKQKGITQILKIGQDLENVKLDLDLFEKQTKRQKERQEQQIEKILDKNKKVGQHTDISGKIDRQFEQLQTRQENKQDEEVDLLAMMDG